MLSIAGRLFSTYFRRRSDIMGLVLLHDNHAYDPSPLSSVTMPLVQSYSKT